MKNIPYELFTNVQLSPEAQRRRVRMVIEHELTPTQRAAVEGYFFEHRTFEDMAREQGVRPSSVYRAMHRGLARVARCLRY